MQYSHWVPYQTGVDRPALMTTRSAGTAAWRAAATASLTPPNMVGLVCNSLDWANVLAVATPPAATVTANIAVATARAAMRHQAGPAAAPSARRQPRSVRASHTAPIPPST